jgi:hypothetical protein
MSLDWLQSVILFTFLSVWAVIGQFTVSHPQRI